MAKQKYDNEFKVMIVELLKSGSKPKQVGQEYNLNPRVLNANTQTVQIMKQQIMFLLLVTI